LNIAQPPLSQSIRRLEQHLGVTLLERSRRNVEMTEAGRVFLEEARRTLMHAELARKLARRVAIKRPEVRVGFIGPALYRVLPAFLKRYRSTEPAADVRLFELSSRSQVAGVSNGDLDIGFLITGNDDIEDCDEMIVERAAIVAAVPSDWPLARRASISPEELASQPFVQPPERFAGKGYAMTIFNRVGVAPEVVQEVLQTNTALSLVGAGIGCTLTTATAALAEPRNVSFLEIEGDVPRATDWILTMIWRSDIASRAAKAFVDTVAECLEQNPDVLSVTARPQRI
jgi:DNA-binding transcriptional LysR family regulator